MPLSARLSIAFTVVWLGALHAGGATLSATPAPFILPPGETYLNSPATLPVAGPFWFGLVLDWGQTEEISIQAAVSNEPFYFANHILIMTAMNNTDQAWSAFEIDLSGPATFALSEPVTNSRASETTTITEQRITFGGMDWIAPVSGIPSSSSISFSYHVTEPIDNEPLVLTFRPVPALPEPGSAAVLLLAGMIACRRNR